MHFPSTHYCHYCIRLSKTYLGQANQYALLFRSIKGHQFSNNFLLPFKNRYSVGFFSVIWGPANPPQIFTCYHSWLCDYINYFLGKSKVELVKLN